MKILTKLKVFLFIGRKIFFRKVKKILVNKIVVYKNIFIKVLTNKGWAEIKNSNFHAQIRLIAHYATVIEYS